MDYNNRAVGFFIGCVLQALKKDGEPPYQNEDALKSLADTYLFAFDANRLLPCDCRLLQLHLSVHFYKLSEDGKLFLTRLTTEKDRTRW